jgi:transposase
MGMNEHTEVEQFIGIDVSKDTLDMGVYPSRETLHVSYDDAGIAHIVQRLKNIGAKGHRAGSHRRIGTPFEH